MPYTTQPDLEAAAGGASRFTELADWDGDNVADAAIVARAQAEADGWIDSHLRRFSAADLAALRANPTDTIKRIAGAETIFWIREKRTTITREDLDLREDRERQLKAMRLDDLRVSDTKTSRAEFVENCSPVSRVGSKGMW